MLDYQLLVWTLLFLLALDCLPYLVISLLYSWQRKQLKFLILTFISAGLIYLLSYFFYFTHNHNLFDLFAFEKYRLSWWTGNRPLRPYLVWQVLFLGKIKTWWADSWNTDRNWNFTIPIIFVASTIVGIKMFWQKIKQNCNLDDNVLLLWLFSALFIGLYTVTSAMAVRYLLIIFPCWWIVVANYLSKKLCENI